MRALVCSAWNNTRRINKDQHINVNFCMYCMYVYGCLCVFSSNSNMIMFVFFAFGCVCTHIKYGLAIN